MPTKNDFGLGTLYHATPSEKADNILLDGIRPVRGIVWLAYDKIDAYRSALDNMDFAGSVTTFAVNLPGNWELEKLETGVYGSRKTIPLRYVKKV